MSLSKLCREWLWKNFHIYASEIYVRGVIQDEIDKLINNIVVCFDYMDDLGEQGAAEAFFDKNILLSNIKSIEKSREEYMIMVQNQKAYFS